MKNILEKMIYAAASCAMLVAVVFTFSSSGAAQNHNPEFSVSNLHFDGSNYIFIGEDDGQAYDPRTKLVLNYREDEPEKGTVTLQWVADPDQDIKDGSSRVLAYGTESGTTGFTDGNGNTSTSGAWNWNEDKLDDYKGREMFLQGVADDSFAGEVVKLQASHTETVDDYAKEFTLLKMDVENLREEIITDAFEVSNKVTSQNLDVQASPSVGDPRTYRVKLPVDLGSSAKIRFDLYDEDGASVNRRRAGENGELPISSKTENAVTFYATDNFRFVTWDTDDAHEDSNDGNQTIKVKLGDTVRMTLNVDSADLAYIELPIGLPPSEDSTKAIRTVDARFIKLDYPNGNVVSQASPSTVIERMDKVFAQGAVRFNEIESIPKGPVRNIIAIEGSATSTGTLLLSVQATQEDDSVQGYQVNATVGAGTSLAVAQAVASAINEEVGREVATSHFTYERTFGSSSIMPKTIAHVVIDKGEEVIYNLAVFDDDLPDARVFVPQNTELSTGDVNNFHTVALLGLNYADSDPNTLDVFVTNLVSVAGGTDARGIALPHAFTGSASPIVGSYCIRLSSSSNNDFDPLIAPHEAGHILLNLTTHPNIPNNLMLDGSVIPETDSITSTKRLTENQIEYLRSASSPAAGMLQAK